MSINLNYFWTFPAFSRLDCEPEQRKLNEMKLQTYNLPYGRVATWNEEKRQYLITDPSNLHYTSDKISLILANKVRKTLMAAGYHCAPVNHSTYGIYTLKIV